MRTNQLLFALFLLLTGDAFQLLAQQNETDRKQLEAVKARAEAGDTDSEYQLGLCYYSGDGVPKDFSKAAKWFRKAAEQNNAAAQCNLGISYASGQGVAKDGVEAAKWFRKAAEQNYADAQFRLGVFYHEGLGVAKDYTEAVK